MATIAPAPMIARAPTFRRALGPLLLLALVMAVGFTAMGSFGVVQEGAKVDLGLTDQALGLIQGLGNAVPLVIFSIPIGILVDRHNRVRMMIVLGALWTIGTLLTAFAPNVATLLAARMLTGVGATGALTAALSLCADFCTPDQRGRALLIVNLGKSIGLAAAFALSGWLFGLFTRHEMPLWFGDFVPWRGTHAALGVLSAALLVPLFFLREPVRHEVESAPDAPFRVVARELWSRRRFLGPLFAGQIAVVMADAAAGVWIAPVLSRRFAMQPQDFGGWVGGLIFLSGIIGAVLGGISADAGQKSGRRGAILLGAVIAAGVGVPMALFPILPNVTMLAIALFGLILSGAVTGLVVSVALTVLIPNELRGLCIGAFIAIAGLIGFGLAPWLVSLVSSLLGGEAHLPMALAMVGVTVSALSFFAFLLAMRRAPLTATAEPIG